MLFATKTPTKMEPKEPKEPNSYVGNHIVNHPPGCMTVEVLSKMILQKDEEIKFLRARVKKLETKLKRKK